MTFHNNFITREHIALKANKTAKIPDAGKKYEKGLPLKQNFGMTFNSHCLNTSGIFVPQHLKEAPHITVEISISKVPHDLNISSSYKIISHSNPRLKVP